MKRGLILICISILAVSIILQTVLGLPNLNSNTEYEYDNFFDNFVNLSLWTNETLEQTGNGILTITEAGGKMTVFADDAGGTAVMKFHSNASDMPAIGLLKNLTMSTELAAHGGSVRSKLVVFGDLIWDTETQGNDNSIWTFDKRSDGQFDVYNDGVFDSTINPVGNIVTLWVRATLPGAPSSASIIWLNYTTTANDINTTLQSPSDSSTIITSQINFTSNASIVGSAFQSVFTNQTLYVWNSTGGIFNMTTATITGNTTNSSTFQIDGFVIGSYKWNTLSCMEEAGIRTICNFDLSNNTFDQGYLINSQTFSTPTQEGAIEEFKINLTYDSSEIDNIAVNLIYNGTSYSSEREGSGDDLVFTSTLSTPSVTTDTNFSFYWEISLDNFDFNSSSNLQEVQSLGLDTCESFPELLFNFTVYDEELKTFLSDATIESYVNIYSIDRSQLILNISNITTNPLSLCLSANITSPIGFALDVVVKYYKDEYAVEYYNVLNATLNSSFQEQNIGLYDLKINDSIEFEVSFTGNDFLPVEGYLIYLEREYVSDGIFRTVEAPLTDVSGKTILHMVGGDVRYNIRLINPSGELIGNFLNIVPYCPNPSFTDCKISLSATSALSGIFQYDSIAGLIYSTAPIYNPATNKISFDFVVPGGLTKLVSLNVTRSDVFGNRTICENSLLAASGTIACSIGDISDTSLISVIGVDGVSVLISSVDIDKADFGSIGFVAWFAISLVLLFVFGDSKNGIMISLLISYVGATALGISKGTVVGIGSAGIWILIITVLAIWRINRRRPQ